MEELRCPECDSIVYSRLHPICGVCGKPLPESFQFGGEQAAVLEVELEHAREALKKASGIPDENLPGGLSTELEVLDRTGGTEA